MITGFGGLDALEVTDVPDPVPKPGQLLVDVVRAGVNYADVHITEDNYVAPVTLPYVLGSEVVGTVAGEDRRVLALTLNGGGYAERAAVSRVTAFDVPDDVDDAQALALAVQGNTAWHLLHTCAPLRPGQSVAVFAAAGGVGVLAVQLARLAAAGQIIAVASTPAKRELALTAGADVAVDPSPVEDLADRLLEANGGRGIDVVLEMTGGPVTAAALAATAPFGRVVLYGFASGTTAVVDTREVMVRSQTLTGFVLPQLIRRRGMLAESMRELFRLVGSGALVPHIGGEYALTDVRRAHEDLRKRATAGKLVLDVSR